MLEWMPSSPHWSRDCWSVRTIRRRLFSERSWSRTPPWFWPWPPWRSGLPGSAERSLDPSGRQTLCGTRRPACHEEAGAGQALPLEVEDDRRPELVPISEPIGRGLRDQDPGRLAALLEPAGQIHGVTPQIV